MAYLVDADVIINILNGRQSVADSLRRYAVERLGISVLTVGEVYEGAFGSVNPHAHLASYRAFLRPFRVIPVTDAIVERFAEIRAHLRRHGEPISDFDVMVGATALHHNLTVLTFNLRHLRRIPGVRAHPPIQ